MKKLFAVVIAAFLVYSTVSAQDATGQPKSDKQECCKKGAKKDCCKKGAKKDCKKDCNKKAAKDSLKKG